MNGTSLTDKVVVFVTKCDTYNIYISDGHFDPKLLQTTYSVFTCLHASLPACQPACLPACQPACLVVSPLASLRRVPACLSACMVVSPLAAVLACVLACLPAWLFPRPSRACLPVCMHDCLPLADVCLNTHLFVCFWLPVRHHAKDTLFPTFRNTQLKNILYYLHTVYMLFLYCTNSCYGYPIVAVIFCLLRLGRSDRPTGTYCLRNVAREGVVYD
jgi:hypothetical protein